LRRSAQNRDNLTDEKTAIRQAALDYAEGFYEENADRMGRITAIVKNALRGTLVEVAWRVIGKDPGMRKTYERIKVRAGSKRAIVAIARRVLLTNRRMLLENRPYQFRMAA
jgi:transposase